MNKKILGLLLALCLVIGLLPIMSVAAFEPATSATATLFGTAYTVDTDDATADVPAAYYWTNGAEEGAAPVAATAADAWNYSFSIIDGVPTVTLKNVNYDYAATFLKASFDGELKVAYEGTNNINVPYKASSGYAFISYSSTTNSAGKGQLTVKGAENATLNVTGGSKGVTMLSVGNKAYLVISGGTVNMERTNAGGVNGVIGAGYSKTTIENCELNVKMVDGVGGKHPAVGVGYSSYGLTINNAKVNIETNAHTALSLGVFQSNMKGILYPAPLTITGDSEVKIVNNANTTSDYAYNGVGIYASKVTVKGGNLEVEGKKQAVYLTATDAIPDLSAYTGEYKMYTEKDGAAVTTYTATPYFKVAAAAPVQTSAPATESSAPVQTSAPAVESSAPVQSSAPAVESSAPVQSSAPSVETTAPAETTAPTVPLDKEYTAKIDGVALKVTHYDVPVYSVNTTKTGYFNTVANSEVTNSVQAEYIGQALGGDESNYNAKLVWHTGDNGPTLYLKNLIVDNYNEDLGKWRYGSATSKNYIANPSIYTDKTAPLKVVVEGGKSEFQTYNGIHYQADLTIESVGDASLLIWTNRNGIIPSSASAGYANSGTHLSGNKLTLNANLTVSLGSFANADNSGYIIRTIGADMIINGGKVVAEYRGAAGKAVNGIGVATSGNLIVNGGYVFAESYNSTNQTGAAYQVAGDIIITGGKVEAASKSQSGMRAANITISGGEVVVNASLGGLVINNTTGVLTINGGKVEVTAGTRAFSYNDTEKTQAYKVPVLGSGVVVTAGASKAAAENVDSPADFEFKVKYAKVDYTVPAPSNPSNPGGSTTPSNPSNPGGSTTPSTPSTPSNPATGDTSATIFVVMMLVAAFGIVATVSFNKKRAV